ncbi:hypothetical protein XA68_13800 [Ophiocordyceps unilateralis]|uniref:proline--tRNA ligase n=1 Tax=Ophiocordyceps unilateralis TaxID=268505 RepID=A0A2A9PUB7_OPHUN|nr:hypothetical protein XA68_13800 [Ophiocordyceps unilateralis]
MLRPRIQLLKGNGHSRRNRAFSHQGLTQGGRPRSFLSKIWTPTGGVSAVQEESGHGKLVRAGFLRQAQSGIFQLLPLGLRVQQKIEALLDKHMQSIGASRLSLSTLTTEELWRKSGRFEQLAPELFRLNDRREVPLMLSPTHEEEITKLVTKTQKSYKDFPLRLYQITRKYRDEMRPRHGLLRSREFFMKDLYTFDTSPESAMKTYHEVSGAYRAFFADLKLPILVAEASSGNMGGDLSHEYLLANPIGEDTVATCDRCGYSASDEVSTLRKVSRDGQQTPGNTTMADFQLWRGTTNDRQTLVNVWHPRNTKISLGVVKEVVSGLDPSVSDPLRILNEARRNSAAGPSAMLDVVNVVDERLVPAFSELHPQLSILPVELGEAQIRQTIVTSTPTGEPLNLIRPANGDACYRCLEGSLRLCQALELGHTFYLGTRYSEPLQLSVKVPDGSKDPVPVQMGCYGIGVSRILGAVAEHKADERGLGWPRAIAPFEVAVVPTSTVTAPMVEFYDKLVDHGKSDIVLDDRKESFGWKMQDADTIGYPVIVVLGRGWTDGSSCEVQCRSLGLKENVALDDVGNYLEGLLSRL